MESERRDDLGAEGVDSCWYCDTTYKNRWQHRYTRHELQAKMAKEKEIHDDFLDDVGAIINKQKQDPDLPMSVFWDGQRRKRPRAVVTAEQEVEEKTTMPTAKFYPMKLYKSMFGDPNSKENKSRGHKKSTSNGYVGVKVPNDLEMLPWDIATSSIKRKKKTDTLHDSHEIPEEEAVDGMADRIYEDAVSDDEHKRSDGLGGWSLQKLMDEIAKKTPKSQEAQSTAEPDEEEEEEEEEEEAVPKPSKSRAQRREGVNVGRRASKRSRDEDEVEEEEPPTKRTKEAPPVPRKGGGRKATSSQQHETPTKRTNGKQTLTSQKDEDATWPKTPSKGGQRKDLHELVARLQEEVCKGASDSLAFGHKYAAVLKSIQRHMQNIAKMIDKTCDDDDKCLLLLDNKNLQVMESGIRLIRNAVGDISRRPPVSDLARRWRSLETFANTEPVATVNWSPWFHDQIMHVCAQGQYQDAGATFAKASLIEKFGTYDEVKQRTYLEVGLSTLLTMPETHLAKSKD